MIAGPGIGRDQERRECEYNSCTVFGVEKMEGSDPSAPHSGLREKREIQTRFVIGRVWEMLKKREEGRLRIGLVWEEKKGGRKKCREWEAQGACTGGVKYSWGAKKKEASGA